MFFLSIVLALASSGHIPLKAAPEPTATAFNVRLGSGGYVPIVQQLDDIPPANATTTSIKIGVIRKAGTPVGETVSVYVFFMTPQEYNQWPDKLKNASRFSDLAAEYPHQDHKDNIAVSLMSGKGFAPVLTPVDFTIKSSPWADSDYVAVVCVLSTSTSGSTTTEYVDYVGARN